jgi:type IV pilus assembly protein PilN
VTVNLIVRVKDRLKQALAWLGWPAAGSAVIAVAAVAGIHFWLSHLEDEQMERAQVIKRETVVLDKEIEEIRKVREEIQAVLVRASLAERFAKERLWPARLFDQLARQRPENLYLRSVRQEGSEVIVMGQAGSYADIATFIGNVAAAAHLERPQLLEVKAQAASRDVPYPVAFTLSFAQRGRTASAPRGEFRSPRVAQPGDPK